MELWKSILFVGCETNWFEFKGHCYIQVQGQYTWNEAKVIKKLPLTFSL